MENQKTGYIPLYRSIKKKLWAKDVYLRALWDNLLLDAARQPYTAVFKGNSWKLQPGQLVVTSDDLGLALCDRKGIPTGRHAVERMLAFFVKEKMILVQTVHRKGTLITILNYAEYAEKIGNLPEHNTAHISEHNKPSDDAASEGDAAHNGEHNTAHHEQEGNNKNKKISSSENSDEFPNDVTEKFLSRHPDAIGGIYTPAGKLWGTADDLKTAKFIFGRVLIINSTVKDPNWPDWANEVRLMREIDGRTLSEICSLYDWASRHYFWKSNILSPDKLRKQWNTLTIQKSQQPNPPQARPAKAELDWYNRDWADSLPPGTL
nr:replication protein [Sodalis sp. dw_96]